MLHHRERLVVHGLLGLLLVLNLATLLSRPAASTAVAAPGSIAELLGPADALLLKGEKGDLRLENRDGRPAWGEQPTARSYSVALVNVGRVLRQQQRSEKFQEEQDALTQELQEKESDYRRRLEELGERLRGMDQSSPDFQPLYEEGEALYSEFMEWGREASARRDALSSRQLESAYRELIAAVEVVSDRRGIDLVLRFIATNDPFQSPTFEGALSEVRLRSVLRYPEALDVTPDVLRELNLRDEE